MFVLHWRGDDPGSSVFLSQRDVRELQFAKASIATGWNILLRELGVDADEIAQVLLAGSFGAYLTPLSAVRIGLVPKLALPRIVSAGNVAGEGAKIAALSLRERAEAHVDPARGRVRRAVRAAPTSTTCSSTSWRSPDEPAGAVGRRCGALAVRRPRDRAPARLGRSTSHPLPALLHNRPERIAPAVEPSCGAARPLRRGRRRLRRLRHATARSTRCSGRAGVLGRATTATTCSRARRCARRWPRSPARTS